MSGNVLEIESLRVELPTRDRRVPVLRGIEMSIRSGEVLGLVGESGSGKSMTARSIMRLLPDKASIEGRVMVNGHDVVTASKSELRRIRSRDVALIFQDPRASIDPVRRCGDQIREVLEVSRGVSRRHSAAMAQDLLKQVRIQDPARVMRAFPFELSGGMLQRVGITLALAAAPALLIADEATTSLDVTVQHEIVAILDGLRKRREVSILFITHDLELASAICDRVAVMYAGQIVEQRQADDLFIAPRHPYTQGLLAARPDVTQRRPSLDVIPGRAPTLGQTPPGCAFHPRCPLALPICAESEPARHVLGPAAYAACHLASSSPQAVTEDADASQSVEVH